MYVDKQGAIIILTSVSDTENDVEALIQRTETEGDTDHNVQKEGSGAFSFAKIWTADKDELEEIGDDEQVQGDSWAQTLQKINAEREKLQTQEEALFGRGARRKAAIHKVGSSVPPSVHPLNPYFLFQHNVYVEDTPLKKNRKGKSRSASDAESAYHGSEIDSDNTDSDSHPADPDDLPDPLVNRTNASNPNAQPLQSISAQRLGPVPVCGLCNQRHGDSECSMTESSQNLVEYREMLILHADDEPLESRVRLLCPFSSTVS